MLLLISSIQFGSGRNYNELRYNNIMTEETKTYFVLIKEKEGEAKLECATYEEAVLVKKSFENYCNGRAHSIEIVTEL